MSAQRRIAAKEATDEQLRTWLDTMEVPQPSNATRGELLEAFKLAQLPDWITVSEAGLGDLPPQVQDLDTMFAKPLVFNEERWFRVRFGEDMNADNKESAVEIIYGNDIVHLPRNRQLCIRERFVRVLHDAQETHVVQAGGEGTGKFSEAKRYMRLRHPFAFLGVAGFVRDGDPPNLTDDVLVIGQ